MPRATRKREIVAVTGPRLEYRRNGEMIEPRRVYKLDQSLAKKFVATLDNRSKLQGIDATKQALNERAQERSAHWQSLRLENAIRKARAATGKGRGNQGSVYRHESPTSRQSARRSILSATSLNPSLPRN